MIYKFELNQNISFAKDNKHDTLHFNWLFRAISLVKEKFLTYTIYNGNEKGKQFHKERVFAYELYRQWANVLESECSEHLVLNAELDKIIEEKIETGDDTENSYIIEERKFPDLVLHDDQGSDNNQMIVCEIKRNTETNISGSAILADLYKLACYMDKSKFLTGKEPFEYGVFILLSGKLEQIKQIEKSQIIVSSKQYTYNDFEKEMSEHFEKIICATYDGNIIKYDTLKAIVTLA